MLMCRSCGQQVASNGFCSNCMTYSNVKDVENEDELGLAKTVSSSTAYRLPTIHGKSKGKRIIYSDEETKIKFYICKYCSKNFRSELRMEHHIKNAHTCKYCGEIFQSKNLLREHIENTHIVCKYCRTDFSSQLLLEQHIKVAHNCKCEYCGEIFQSINILKQHIKNAHIICKYCGNNFQSINILKQHIKNAHIICKYCGNNFQSKRILEQHLINVHFQCEYCGKNFPSKNILEQHIISRHTCKHCGIIYKSKTMLKEHIKNAHDNNQKKENPKSSVSKPHSMKKLCNDIRLREANRNIDEHFFKKHDEHFFKKYDEQKVTILAETQIYSHNEDWIKKVHLGCKIIEPNKNGIRIQKWIQGRISFKHDGMPKFARKEHPLACISITLDENNRDSGTLIVKDIKKGWI